MTPPGPCDIKPSPCVPHAVAPTKDGGYTSATAQTTTATTTSLSTALLELDSVPVPHSFIETERRVARLEDLSTEQLERDTENGLRHLLNSELARESLSSARQQRE